MWNRPVEKYLWQFWNKSNRKWVHWESGHLWGAARSALATFWIDLHKFGQCKRLTCHTAQGIELCHVGLQCIFMMLGAVEEKLPALEGFGSPTNIYVSRGTWLGRAYLVKSPKNGFLSQYKYKYILLKASAMSIRQQLVFRGWKQIIKLCCPWQGQQLLSLTMCWLSLSMELCWEIWAAKKIKKWLKQPVEQCNDRHNK